MHVSFFISNWDTFLLPGWHRRPQSRHAWFAPSCRIDKKEGHIFLTQIKSRPWRHCRRCQFNFRIFSSHRRICAFTFLLWLKTLNIWMCKKGCPVHMFWRSRLGGIGMLKPDSTATLFELCPPSTKQTTAAAFHSTTQTWGRVRKRVFRQRVLG